VGNPRGEQPDAFSNRFEAVAAGLGRIGRAGFVLTNEFGPNVRFVSVITDAEVAPDAPNAAAGPADACVGCDRCIAACAAAAFGAETVVDFGQFTDRFQVIDAKRCDWSKRYSLNGEEGANFMGWDMRTTVPDEVTPATLAEGLRQIPVIKRHHPCNFEACLMACPQAR
jgi:epoxyqueuosine reductase QueG